MFARIRELADALVELAAHEGGPAAMVHVRVDHTALVRGFTEEGEVCEVPGIGPIPVAAARRLADDAILKVLLTDGADIAAVAHLGRTIPARLRTALEARDPVCVVPGCDVRRGLEIDHLVPRAEGKDRGSEQQEAGDGEAEPHRLILTAAAPEVEPPVISGGIGVSADDDGSGHGSCRRRC